MGTSRVRHQLRLPPRPSRRRRRGAPWSPEPPFEMPPACPLIVPGRGEMFLRDSGGDELVPVHKQQELAAAAGGPVFEVALGHLELVRRTEEYNPRLLEALDALRSRIEPAVSQPVP